MARVIHHYPSPFRRSEMGHLPMFQDRPILTPSEYWYLAELPRQSEDAYVIRRQHRIPATLHALGSRDLGVMSSVNLGQDLGEDLGMTSSANLGQDLGEDLGVEETLDVCITEPDDDGQLLFTHSVPLLQCIGKGLVQSCMMLFADRYWVLYLTLEEGCDIEWVRRSLGLMPHEVAISFA